MKYYIIFYGLCFSLFRFTNASCQINDSLIFGGWKIDSAFNGNTKNPNSNKERIKNDVKKYYFYKDSTFSINHKTAKMKEKGKFTVTKDNEITYLTFINPFMDISSKFEILELTSESLSLKADYGTTIFLMYLSKSK